MEALFLTRTRYLNGLICPKMLWLRVNRREAFGDAAISVQSVENSKNVQMLARQLFDPVKVIEHGEYAVMEEETEYNTTVQLGDEEAENKNIKQFRFTDPTTLVITNTLNGHIPTGVMTPFKRGAVMIFIAAVPIGLFIYLRRRKEQFS